MQTHHESTEKTLITKIGIFIKAVAVVIFVRFKDLFALHHPLITNPIYNTFICIHLVLPFLNCTISIIGIILIIISNYDCLNPFYTVNVISVTQIKFFMSFEVTLIVS